jgi:flagellar basal-body rod protein FlgG
MEFIMVRGIYSSASGMITQYKQIDVLGNNTANVDTPGFKANNLSFTTFGDEIAKRMQDNVAIGDMPAGVTIGGESTDLSSGSYQQTNISTDLAINGNGFFAVQSPSGGGVKYTRDGEFSVDSQGFLALPTGERLLDATGQQMNVGGDQISVAPDGTVTTATGAKEKIDIYDTQNEKQNVVKRADGFFDITGASPVTQTAIGSIKQGYIEESNTDMVSNMTQMMEATRAFQGCQQAFQISDDTLDKLVTQVGSIK